MTSKKEDLLTECHALWTGHDAAMQPLVQQLDQMLLGYVFYPEFEWPVYEVTPPENHPLLGAWRTTEGSAFVFLLEVYHPQKYEPNYLIILVSPKEEMQSINQLISSHKLNLSRIEKKELAKANAQKSLENEKKSNSIEGFSKVIGFFTLIITGLSFYLKEISPPEIVIGPLKEAYTYLVLAVHFSALLLLLLIVVISIIYTIRYGYMMWRRM
jgi:hypothetical protein